MAIANAFRRTASATTMALALGVAAPVVVTGPALAATVSSIVVQGNRRVEDDTVRSFLTIRPGESFGSSDIDESVRQLFGTRLFADVRVRQSGNQLIVDVIEESIVGSVTFIGNSKVQDGRLSAITQTDPRDRFDPATVARDEQAIADAYSAIGRTVSVTSEASASTEGRVDVVYRINEGERTKISAINFVGNDAFSDRRLRNVIDTRRSTPLSFFSRRDVYDENRIGADEETLRRFYFNRGYADFQIASTVADFDETENSFVITITVDEGQRYTFGDIEIDSTVPGIDVEALRRKIRTRPGRVYSAEEVEDTLIALSDTVANNGFAFAEVTPRGDRDFASQTISIDYLIDQGPRVFVERIEVRGNTRTRDYVIRREFDVSEGDAFNRVLIQRAKRRLERLDYFETVEITTVPGSDPDRIVVVVRVEDKSTGEFGIGAGYSTGSGLDGGGRPSFDLSITERNLLGRGQFVRGSVTGSASERKYAISFTEPYFLGRRIAAGFDLALDQGTFDGYDFEQRSGALRLSAPLTENLRVTGFYAYRSEDYTITDPNQVSGATLADAGLGNYVTSSVGYALNYSSFDDPRNPRNGFFGEFRQEFAGVGGDANWLKTTAKAAYVRTLNEEFDVVGTLSAGAGNIVNLGDTPLRTFDNFFTGPSRIRGFAARGIGPRAAALTGQGASLGGTNIVNATAEVAFPLPVIPEELGFRGAVFADAASVWDYGGSRADLVVVGPGTGQTVVNDGFDLRASVGVSLLWASPFGPLRLDYAEPVAKVDGDQVQNFNFGISSSF